jgi:hypothetical protein
MSKYTTVIEYKIFDDDTGNYIRIGEDSDGLDLVEIFAVKDGQAGESILLSRELAKEVVKTLCKFLGE